MMATIVLPSDPIITSSFNARVWRQDLCSTAQESSSRSTHSDFTLVFHQLFQVSLCNLRSSAESTAPSCTETVLQGLVEAPTMTDIGWGEQEGHGVTFPCGGLEQAANLGVTEKQGSAKESKVTMGHPTCKGWKKRNQSCPHPCWQWPDAMQCTTFSSLSIH